jgi:hypothetical protein
VSQVACGCDIGATVLRDDGLREVNFAKFPGGRDFESLFVAPQRVLVNIMREHQRYFALEDSKACPCRTS